MKPRLVLAFSRAAGGAAAIAPVLLQLRRSERLLVLAKDQATEVFHRAGLDPVRFPAFSEGVLQRTIGERFGDDRPHVLLTSATSLPQLDMTEQYLWRWACAHQIPSVAVLDQWQNYALRFSGQGPEEHLRYLPDWIAAMDAHAARGLGEAGIPAERIVITGQPAFDQLAQMRQSATSGERHRVREALAVVPQAKLVCAVSESFANVFGDDLGYTEQTMLQELLGICSSLVNETGQPLHLAVKLHPENDPHAFRWVHEALHPNGLRVSLHGTEWAPIPLVMGSDVVVGMSSVLLIESILLGQPTVSFQPHARHRDALIATVLGAIPLLDRPAQCADVLRGLLFDPSFQSTYLQRQGLLKTDGGAAHRVAELVKRASARVAVCEATG